MSSEQSQVDYKVLNIAKLRTFAKQQGLEGVGKMKKTDIINALEGRPQAHAPRDDNVSDDEQPPAVRPVRPAESKQKQPTKDEESGSESEKPSKPRSVNMRLLKADVKKAVMACNDHQVLFNILSSLSD